MKKAEEVYSDVTKEITHKIAERLKIPMHAHPKSQSYSFVYNGLSCDLQVARQDNKKVLRLEAVPLTKYYEQFVKWIESYFEGNKALKERPEFEKLRTKEEDKPDKISRLEEMLPLKSYHINHTGLKATYAISNQIDLVNREGRNTLTDVAFDALRVLLLFPQKVR